VEACPHLHRTVEAIRGLAAQPGVALNPATPLVTLDEILPAIDVALLMSVNPGFGGQAFIPSTVDNVARLRALLRERDLARVAIEVAGGVDPDNMAALAAAGMTIAVAGTSVFGAGALVGERIALLRAACAAAPARGRPRPAVRGSRR